MYGALLSFPRTQQHLHIAHIKSCESGNKKKKNELFALTLKK